MLATRRFAALLTCVVVVLGCTATVTPTPSQDSQHKDSPQRDIDLVQLIELFYGKNTPGGVTHLWFTGALPGSPIEWKTDGVSDCESGNCREGQVVATITGEPTHRTLKQYSVPGHWKVLMSGANVGFSKVEFEPDDSMRTEHVWEIISYVADRIPLTPFKCTQANPEGLYSSAAIFRINRPDIPQTWLAIESSIGSSGHYIELILYNLEHQARAFECFYARTQQTVQWPTQFRSEWASPPEMLEKEPTARAEVDASQNLVTQAIEEMVRDRK